MYVRLAYAVSLPRKTHLTCPTVCFVGDGATGQVVSYALSLGHPEASLFSQAVTHLNSKNVMNARGVQCAFFSRVLSTKFSGGHCKLEFDYLRPSLDWRILKKTSVVDQDEVGYELLKYLYDWSLEDHTLEESTGMDLNCALRIIDTAIARFNETRVPVVSL